jgi:hypothetical protein
MTIAEFIESEPELSKFSIVLRAASNITLSPEELDILFDGDVPYPLSPIPLSPHPLPHFGKPIASSENG